MRKQNKIMGKQEYEHEYQRYQEQIKSNAEKEYKPQRGWGIVKPIIDMKVIGPLCKYQYRGHLKGCFFCRHKRLWDKIADTKQEVYALYFTMNLWPLWTKLEKRHPHWTSGQVQNNRYWRATKHKLLKELEIEFLESHPGPWVKFLNRAPDHTTYTFGIHYTETMKQIGVDLQWPPEPYPITIQFLGRPISGVDYSWANFILSEETVGKRRVRKTKREKVVTIYTDQEASDDFDFGVSLSSADILT